MDTQACDVAVLPELTEWRQQVLEELGKFPYRPAWWLPNRHLQTVWTATGRRKKQIPFERERWTTPDDDFLDLVFMDRDVDAPLVLMLHGLEGSMRSGYVGELAARLHEQGWGAALMQFRTCNGEINRAPRTYHLGETADLAFVVEQLMERFPGRPLYLAGVSLGGNVLLKWLGELGNDAPEAIRGAAAISCPFDVTVSGPHIDRALGGAYVRWFLRTLIPKALEKAEQYPDLLDAEKIRASKNFVDYDTHATAALHGFEDAYDYWRRCSCGQFLHGIRRPALLLTSADDPFNPANTLPHEAVRANPYLVPQFTEAGGHMGFVMGATPWNLEYWAEAQAARYFVECEANPPPRP